MRAAAALALALLAAQAPAAAQLAPAYGASPAGGAAAGAAQRVGTNASASGRAAPYGDASAAPAVMYPGGDPDWGRQKAAMAAAQQQPEPVDEAAAMSSASPAPPATGAAADAAASGFVGSYTRSYNGGGGGGPDEATLTLHELTLYTLEATDADAVCNDGSPGGFYFSPGTDSNLWVIYLQGGMWCWDQASCVARQQGTPFEMSSTGWARTQSVGGIFSTSAGNPWANANKVYLEYCSSDAWVGDVPASPATFGYAFRGQRIISATIANLVAMHGLGSDAQVLFGGCSAGARGAMFNLDYVGAMLPTGASLKGLLDSALWVDLQPLDALEVSLQTQTQDVYNMVGPSARIPAACAAQYAGEEWKCLFGTYRLPFLQTPYIINAAQFDSFQMLYDLGGSAPTAPGQVAFADSFQAATLAALQQAVQAGQAVFSTTCLVHCLTDDTQDFTGSLAFTANGVNIATALSNWYFGGKTPVEISSCSGYPCVQQCPNGNTVTDLPKALAAQAALADGGASAAGPAAGSEVNGVWVQRQQSMGFGTMPAQQQSGVIMPAGQGYAAGGGGTQDAVATSWLSMGRRMLRAH